MVVPHPFEPRCTLRDISDRVEPKMRCLELRESETERYYA